MGYIFGEREIFLGTWDYNHSIVVDNCPPVALDTLYSSDLNNQYYFEITKREKIFWVVNETVEEKTPFRVDLFGDSSLGNDYFAFSIYFEEAPINTVNGHVSSDTLILFSYWPPEVTNDGCKGYSNYFIKR